jgi:YVTN family beta-propeller protein
MQTRRHRPISCLSALASIALMAALPTLAAAGDPYQIYVSNEKSGDITVISGTDFKVLATIPAGKRPRGIHASPDGKVVYVALSGTPVGGPPQLDAQGNPILKRAAADDDDDKVNADKSADGIGIVDVKQRRVTGKINAGSDPEEFSLSKDGTRLYVSNEDVKTASVINIASGKVEHIIPVGLEPEGAATSPDGKRFYITCEAGGDVYAIDTQTYTVAGHFKVAVRPRTMAFLPDGKIGFVPSESTGQLNVVDTNELKVIKVIDLPNGSRPMSVKMSTDGNRVYVSGGRSGAVSVLDSHTYALIGTIKVGQRPWGIVISPDGKYLFSANGPSNDVSVVDLATSKEVTRVKAGESPWGIAIVQ